MTCGEGSLDCPGPIWLYGDKGEVRSHYYFRRVHLLLRWVGRGGLWGLWQGLHVTALNQSGCMEARAR